MARPTLPSYGDAASTSDTNGWVAVLKAAIFAVSDTADAAASAASGKATDSLVVHLAGTETITGSKTVTGSLTVPTPTASGHAAPKGYVDNAVAGVTGGSGAAVDDSTNLSSATVSTTAPWSANNTKNQILGFINDASSSATNRTWSASKIVSYVANSGTGSGGAVSVQRYEIPASSLSYPASGATEAVKLAAINANSSTVRSAMINNPDMLVVLPPQKPVLLQVDIDEILDTSFSANQNYALAGPVAIARGTRTSATDTTTGRITARPPLRIRRKAGTVFTPQNLRNTVQIGPSLPNAGSVFTSVCSGFEVASGYNRFKSGQIIHLCSNDSYAWAARAGYTFVGKAAMFPVAGILITITGLTYTALDTALSGQTPARTSGSTLERFTIVGATSGAVAVVAGDIAGTSQIVVDNVSGDFTSGETIREQSTNASVGTFGGATVCMSGLLNTTYPTTPQMRIMTRSSVDISGLRVFADGDPDDLVLAWNRTDCAQFIGCMDVNFEGVKIDNGYAAGIVTRSCWNVRGDITCRALPNHAIEAKNTDGTSDTKRVESSYGYIWRAIGATDHFDVKVDATFARHAVTSNGIGATWGQDERTGAVATSADLCTNYWSHGCGGRNGRVTGIARSMLATGWDTHEGSEDWLFDTPMSIEPLSAAKNTTAPDGATLRGFNMTILNPYFDGVRIGVMEQAIALQAGGLVWQNRILGGVMKNLQLGGYTQSEDADVETESSFLVKGTTFHCNPAILSTQYAQYAMLFRRSITRVEDVRAESVNDRFFRFTSFVGDGSTGVGRVSMNNTTIDFTNSTATRIFSLEATYASVSVIKAHALVNPVAGTQKPFYWFTNSAGDTPVKYRDLTDESLSSSTGKPALQQTTAGTPTFTAVTALGDSSSGSGGGTQVSVDGAAVATLAIDSTPVYSALYIGADVTTGMPAAGTTVADLSQLQKTLPVGSYLVKAKLWFSMSATGGGTLRFGFGGAGSSGATLSKATALQCNNITSGTLVGGSLTSLAASGATATTAGGNVFGNSPGVAAQAVWVDLEGRLLVTTAGVLGVTWTLSNGATATPTLNAGSVIEFRKVT